MALPRPFVDLLLILAILIAQVSSQSPVSRAEIALGTLQQWYNQTSGIWNTCGWWNGANCLTVIADLAEEDSSVLGTADYVFNNTYVMAPAVNPAPGIQKVENGGRPYTRYPPSWPYQSPFHHPQSPNTVNASAWLDGYYDDDAWWALAWIAAYDVTKNPNYLSLAEGIFEALTQGWPTNCSSGGIWWDTTHTYVNAIANELFLSVAAHLANRASNPQYYVDWAQREWQWFRASGMINAENTINDGLTTTCQNNGETVWSYNQGVILGGLVELNKAAPNPSYLDVAGKIAMAAIQNLTDAHMVIHDVCEPDCAPDGTQFKGIFIRNLQLLQSVAPRDEYVSVINACADSIWANDRNNDNQLSVDWSGPFIVPPNASTQSSAMDALIAAIVY